MFIYNKKAKFIIYGTGDDWDVNDRQYNYDGKPYHLSFFNKIFMRNDINILKEVFLSKNINIKDDCFYEYQRMGTNLMNGYGTLPKYITERKNLDEICVSLTNVYKRLYSELSENRKETLEKFSLILTSLNIVNCEFARGNCKEFLPIVKYIYQFTENPALREYIYKYVYQNLEKYNFDKFIIDYNEKLPYNFDHNPIDTELISRIKEQDQIYLKNIDQNKILPYINNDELSQEEQKKRFCDEYKEENIL